MRDLWKYLLKDFEILREKLLEYFETKTFCSVNVLFVKLSTIKQISRDLHHQTMLQVRQIIFLPDLQYCCLELCKILDFQGLGSKLGSNILVLVVD
jgi:hypothetical protein